MGVADSIFLICLVAGGGLLLVSVVVGDLLGGVLDSLHAGVDIGAQFKQQPDHRRAGRQRDGCVQRCAPLDRLRVDVRALDQQELHLGGIRDRPMQRPSCPTPSRTSTGWIKAAPCSRAISAASTSPHADKQDYSAHAFG